MTDLLRVYLDPSEIGADGYPYAWRGAQALYEANGPPPIWVTGTAIKDLVRELADYRCVRCGHPYPLGITETCPRGEWTPCDERCQHGGPLGLIEPDLLYTAVPLALDNGAARAPDAVSLSRLRDLVPVAHWRILTTHHLNGIKHDCRWWNLAALCQRCHLQIQGRVVMDRVYPLEHSDWFKPYAAGWYAFSYLGEELTREETMDRLEELLALERVA